MTRRLFFALAGLAVVVLLLSDVLGRDQVVVSERRGAVIDLEREAFKVALAAQDDLEHDVTPAQAAAIQRFARRTAGRLGAVAVVTDRTGRVVAAAPTRVRATGTALARREAAAALRRSTTASRTVRLTGDDYEVAEVPIVANQGIVGVVLLAQRSAVLDAAASDRLAFLTPALLIAIALSIVLALLLARALSRPLAQLVGATRRVAREGGSAPSVEPRGPAELRELAEAFNAMSLRVRDLIDRQSQFASDVSHQLRTPLTTLGVAVERTRERGRAGDIDGAGESLAAVQAEVTRLRALVEGLLVLTRVPLADAPRQGLDVAAVARERATLWRELAREYSVTLTVARTGRGRRHGRARCGRPDPRQPARQRGGGRARRVRDRDRGHRRRAGRRRRGHRSRTGDVRRRPGASVRPLLARRCRRWRRDRHRPHDRA